MEGGKGGEVSFVIYSLPPPAGVVEAAADSALRIVIVGPLAFLVAIAAAAACLS